MSESKNRKRMSWEDVCHYIAQGAINIEEGLEEIEAGSKVHQAMVDFCFYMSTNPRLKTEIINQLIKRRK